MEERKIGIIGAGIAGLVAAIELERAGLSPTVFEASDRVGGRVKTDEHDGFLLDHGFQVLLTAYPEAQRYLNYDALDLKMFEAGALIFGADKPFMISDPLRQPTKLFSMAFSTVGSVLDKLKLFKLTQELKKKSIEAIFEEPSISTALYLKYLGFSDQIIHNFFKPFFAGIFLEDKLETSSRMFEFVFKMFSSGHAAVPSKGMEQIPLQLHKQLTQTQIHFNTSVKQVYDRKVFTSEGAELEFDRIIIATQPDTMMHQLQGQFEPYNEVITLYFSLERSFMVRPMIGLVPDEHMLINNLMFMSDISAEYSSNGRALLSVSILQSERLDETLIGKVQLELEKLSGVKAAYFKFVKSYHIPNAIPRIDDMKASVLDTSCKITDHIFLAGDYLLNGSLNAAMCSGRTAAHAVIRSFH